MNEGTPKNDFNYLDHNSEEYDEPNSESYQPSAFTCSNIAERLEQVLRLVGRSPELVPSSNLEELHNLRAEFQSLAKQTEVDSDAINRLQIRLYQLVDSNSELHWAHQLARKFQMFHLLTSKLEWIRQHEKQKGMTPDEASIKDSLAAECHKLKQILIDQQMLTDAD